MAGAVARAIERPGHLVVEAGTGVGKSFAYLVPAIQAAVALKKKVVVSTHTIALQEQLIGEGHPVSAVGDGPGVLGRSGQGTVELHQPAAAGRGASAPARAVRRPPGDRPACTRSRAGRSAPTTAAVPTWTIGPFPASGRPFRAKTATAWARNARGTSECFFYRARRRAQNANVLIVNHALFVTDLALRAAGFGMLPNYEVAIIDEAHTLESVAGEHLGLKLSSIGVDYTLVAALQRADRSRAARRFTRSTRRYRW